PRGRAVFLRPAPGHSVRAAARRARTPARAPAVVGARVTAAMASLETTEFWARFVEIGFLNLLLSGDNAVVIALAVRALPGGQRTLGQIWGPVAAVGLRLLFVGVITVLLRVPLLRLAGGLLLLWIAVRLVRPGDAVEGGARHGSSFWEAIWIIIVADITMSL